MELSVIRDLVAIFGVIAGFTYYVITVRNAQRTRELTLLAQENALETRQAQMFMQIYNVSHNDPSFLEAMSRCLRMQINSYDEFMKIRENDEDRLAIGRIGMFLEGLGVLVREGYVDIKLVALLMTGTTRLLWEQLYGEWVEEGRERMNYRRFRSEAQYLYDELMKYVKEHPELAT
jgi:hypothetical protein